MISKMINHKKFIKHFKIGNNKIKNIILRMKNNIDYKYISKIQKK